MKCIIHFCLISLWFFSFAAAKAEIYLTANFDDLTEGSQGGSFSDGGISFFNLDERIPEAPAYGTFTIQATTADLPGFSPPNYLTFGGYVPGDTSGFGFGRFGSASIAFPGTALSASMDIFGFGDSSLNTLTLEAMLGDNVVDSDTVTFYNTSLYIVYLPLSVSGMFDGLKLVAAGSDNNGTDFFGMDNLNVTIIPEEPVSVLLCYGLSGFLVFRYVKGPRCFPIEVDAA